MFHASIQVASDKIAVAGVCVRKKLHAQHYHKYTYLATHRSQRSWVSTVSVAHVGALTAGSWLDDG